MRSLFKRAGGDPEGSPAERAVRHSRGWGELNKVLHQKEGLRVLDFGPTSPANINYLTALGHSVYMANVVSDAAAAGRNAEGEFDLERFRAASLAFSDRVFDVVLLWDTANYLPAELIPPFFQRMHEVLQPGGHLLAFFHAKNLGPETVFSRYQLTETDELAVLRTGPFPIVGLYQTRQIENLLSGFEDVRFFLGKDNIRELYATR